MRHHNSNRKFGRERKVRQALIKSLARSLILHGKIRTTESKARELRPFVEKMISIGRVDVVANRRQLISKIGEMGTKKLIKDISPKYLKTNGGYTRITKLPQRVSDGSFEAVIELI